MVTLSGPSHQVFHGALDALRCIMAGFGVQGELYFTSALNAAVSSLLSTLKDPALPLMELQEQMSAISGRIPPSVDNAIQTCLARYASNMTSVLSQFPSQEVCRVYSSNPLNWYPSCAPIQIQNIINRHAAAIQKRSEHDQFFMNTNPIMQVVQRLVHAPPTNVSPSP